ncbi:MAG: U32 family peptidase [Bacilli bacterium]|nr:U32 family peptidase [Bacilli bacterium]
MKIIYKTNKKFKNADAFLFGLKGFSTLEEEITLEELSSFSDKKIFLAVDKNMFNSDLSLLENILSNVDKYNISGILFYDLSVLSICKRLGVKTPLIWNQNYLVTNYKTCNFYEKEGVSGAVISSLITHDEIVNICNKTKFDIFVYGFGYQMMALSKRRLISDYFEYIKESDNKDVHYMIEKDDSYPTIESSVGTKMYTKDILNSIKYINELKKAGVKYLILDDFMIDDDIFLKVSEIYERAVNSDLGDDELIAMEQEIKALLPNVSTMFLDKKTVFKVKR